MRILIETPPLLPCVACLFHGAERYLRRPMIRLFQGSQLRLPCVLERLLLGTALVNVLLAIAATAVDLRLDKTSARVLELRFQMLNLLAISIFRTLQRLEGGLNRLKPGFKCADFGLHLSAPGSAPPPERPPAALSLSVGQGLELVQFSRNLSKLGHMSDSLLSQGVLVVANGSHCLAMRTLDLRQLGCEGARRMLRRRFELHFLSHLAQALGPVLELPGETGELFGEDCQCGPACFFSRTLLHAAPGIQARLVGFFERLLLE